MVNNGKENQDKVTTHKLCISKNTLVNLLNENPELLKFVGCSLEGNLKVQIISITESTQGKKSRMWRNWIPCTAGRNVRRYTCVEAVW